MRVDVIPRDGLLRKVGPGELADYRRDGATVLRRIVPESWIDALRTATERLMRLEDTPVADPLVSRFFTLTYAWRLDPVHRAWALHGPGVDIAHQVLAATRKLNLYGDQVTACELGAKKVTPFSQDHTRMSLTGSQVLSLWVPLDVVDRLDGAAHYLKGSHRGPVYRRGTPEGNNLVGSLPEATARSEPLPDFAKEYHHHEWLIGECEPGDVILAHPRTVHGRPADIARSARRATTVIYTGDDVRWSPRSGSWTDPIELMGRMPLPDLDPGDRLDSDLFPVVWKKRAAGRWRERWAVDRPPAEHSGGRGHGDCCATGTSSF